MINKLADDIALCDIEQIKSVYEDLAGFDLHLTGWIDYSEVAFALRKHGVSYCQITCFHVCFYWWKTESLGRRSWLVWWYEMVSFGLGLVIGLVV